MVARPRPGSELAAAQQRVFQSPPASALIRITPPVRSRSWRYVHRYARLDAQGLGTDLEAGVRADLEQGTLAVGSTCPALVPGISSSNL